MIYFIKQSGAPLVKIGKADNVKKRLIQLQTANPFKLELLHQHEGGEWVERELHKHLKPARVRGEWFDMGHPLVQAVLDWIAQGKTALQYLSKTFVEEYNDRLEYNRKVRLINLVNAFKSRQNKPASQPALNA